MSEQVNKLVILNDRYLELHRKGYFEAEQLIAHPDSEYVKSKYDEVTSSGIACAIYVSTPGFLVVDKENYVPHYYLYVRDSWENKREADKLIRSWRYSK